jgi:hypothetical protein
MFPFLKDAETAQRSPDEWRRAMVECLQGLDDIDGSGRMQDWQAELAAAGIVAKLYPLAKEQLIAEGLDRDRVEAMPVDLQFAMFNDQFAIAARTTTPPGLIANCKLSIAN